MCDAAEAIKDPPKVQFLLQACADGDMVEACRALIEKGLADPDVASPSDPREPRTIGKGRAHQETREFFTTVGLLLGQCAFLAPRKTLAGDDTAPRAQTASFPALRFIARRPRS